MSFLQASSICLEMQLTLLLLFLITPCVTPLNFDFPSFPSTVLNSLIIPEGDVSISSQFLRLTKSAEDDVKNGSVGRASYYTPFFLRQNSTGKLADFTTNFTFVINSQKATSYGDGLAFFLAPNGSSLNSTLGGGGSLGLPFDKYGNSTSRNQYPFVAVEFDIYQNKIESILDPRYDHIGIDINSVKSNETTPWNGSVTDGQINTARISYESSSKNLSVAFTSYVNGVQVMRYLDYKVDLLQYLPDLVIVGFTAATGASIALHKINSWSFNSTSLSLSDENSTTTTPVVPPPSTGVKPKSGSDENSTTTTPFGLAVGLGVGGCVILIGMLGLVWFMFWKKKETGDSDDEDPMVNDSIDKEFEKGTGSRKYSYSRLARSTGNFAEAEKLGEGGFGGVYKGFIKELNSEVAVKRISSSSNQGMKEYSAEVTIISRLRHRNLVQLIGWCHEKGECLLVYEFMPNGSLDSHLFKAKSLLAWEARYRIAQGLASGLFYLHQEGEQCVLHRDIKASNVMLDSNFNAKLGDFGLAQLVDHGKESQTTVQLAGTRGYMAPEYVTTGKASMESDVYSFGIVALEIACGRKPVDPAFGRSQINMVEWVWKLYGEGKVLEAADPKLCGDFDEKQMECLMIVGLSCAHPDYNVRPLIQQAIQVLNFDVPLPILPSKMPLPTYFDPPVLSFSAILSSDSTTGFERGRTESSGHGYSTNSSQFTTSSAANSSPSTSLLYTQEV